MPAKIRTWQLCRTGKFGQTGASITRQDLQDLMDTFTPTRPISIGHDMARGDSFPKFGDVLALEGIRDDPNHPGEQVLIGSVMLHPELDSIILPVALLYVSLGLLFGSFLTDKQVGGVCGVLLTNLSAWLSGIWFDLELVGGAFREVAYCLPFVHAVELERAALSGELAAIPAHLAWVLGYALLSTVAAVLLFLRQMKRQ